MTNRFEIPEALTVDILNHLNCEWADGSLRMKIENYIAMGMVYINGKYGEEADYMSDGLPRTLLFEYVRYQRDNALDVFENNYKTLILSMQNTKAVQKNATSEAQQT